MFISVCECDWHVSALPSSLTIAGVCYSVASCPDPTAVPSDQQRLICRGRQLEDGRTLQYYGMKERDVIHLVLRLLGGGAPTCQFTNVSDSSSMTVCKWATSAPTWRRAAKGLCVEGVCDNPACAAHGQWVIDNRGFGSFDLLLDQPKCTCPVCHLPIAPATCAFNNCEWRYVGTYDTPGGGGGDVCVASKSWLTAGDAYHRFSDSVEDEVGGSSFWLLSCDGYQDFVHTPRLLPPAPATF